jgi:molybdate transport system substrate-binding protein
MNARQLTRRLLLALTITLGAAWAQADEIRVITSGGFTGAYKILAPLYEQATGHKIVTAFGASFGPAPTSIPVRLAKGDQFDVVILTDSALDALIKDGYVTTGSRVDLGRSLIGMSVRKGAPHPDISTVAALKQTLLNAESIVYSASASGLYLSKELFPRMGVADALKDKAHGVTSDGSGRGEVGMAVLRGDAEIGFQQVSELLPFTELDFVGPLPDEVQQKVFFSAGIVSKSTSAAAARAFVKYLSSPAAAAIIRTSGLDPVAK